MCIGRVIGRVIARVIARSAASRRYEDLLSYEFDFLVS